MSKGLGQQQKAILRIMSGMESGGGHIKEVYYQIKEALYPDMMFRVNTYAILRGCNTADEACAAMRSHEDYLKQLRKDPGRPKKLSRIRVSVCTSAGALIKRGYIEKARTNHGYWHLTITDKGREAINPNAFPRKNVRV